MNPMDEALNLENRRRIYESIATNPGTHVREMERALDMQPGLLSYHLDYLEKRKLVRAEDDGHRKMYFIMDRFIEKDRRTLGALRQESPRRILMLLLVNGPSSFQNLQTEMGLAKSTLSYHLKRLRGIRVIEVTKIEKEMVYRVDDADRVADLLIGIQESLSSDAVDRFADIWNKLGERKVD
jgi:predicted transcriptional regulator